MSKIVTIVLNTTELIITSSDIALRGLFLIKSQGKIFSATHAKYTCMLLQEFVHNSINVDDAKLYTDDDVFGACLAYYQPDIESILKYKILTNKYNAPDADLLIFRTSYDTLIGNVLAKSSVRIPDVIDVLSLMRYNGISLSEANATSKVTRDEISFIKAAFDHLGGMILASLPIRELKYSASD